MQRRFVPALAAVILTVVGSLTIASTWTKMSTTSDEGTHLATGIEWWQYGTYTMWTENPPLARIVPALAPYWGGLRLPAEARDPVTGRFPPAGALGQHLIYQGGDPQTLMAKARVGTLLFYLLSVLLAGVLAGRGGRWVAGGLAAAMCATLPPLLAHAGLATTDMGFVAMFLLATWTFVRWLDDASWPRAIVCGVALALALLCKFTALMFFPITAAAYVVTTVAGRGLTFTGWRTRSGHVALALAVAAVVVWAGYRFSYGPVDGPALATRASSYEILKPRAERAGLQALLGDRTLPAPELFHGLLHLRAHHAAGHPVYLFGQLGQFGFPAFYPVALFFKAPLSFWLFVAAGLVALALGLRARRMAHEFGPLAAALGILAALATSQVNLGVRHALVIYPLLAAAAATGLVAWFEARSLRAQRLGLGGAVALVLSQTGIALAAAPNLLSYFNPLAGDEPGHILLDSDMDWGQGIRLLGAEARARGIDQLKVALRISATRACAEGLPPLEALVPHQPTTGFIAITENLYWGRTEAWTLKDPCNPQSTWGRDGDGLPPGWFRWLHAHRPIWRAAGMRLYHIEAATPP